MIQSKHPEAANRPEPIAITGIGCRLPGGVEDATGLWHFLLRGGDGVAEVPRDRFDIDAWYDPEPGRPGKLYCRHLGVLDASMAFDPEPFGITPREAAAMDPQHRLLLEVAWQALEDAGKIRARWAAAGQACSSARFRTTTRNA